MNARYDTALALLRGANSATIDGRSIGEAFLWRGVSLWSFWQVDLWFQLLAHVGLNGEPVHPVTSNVRTNQIKTWVLRFWMLAVSALSMAWCLIRRPKVVLFTPDIVVGPYRNDPRISNIYETLTENHDSFVELVHTRLGRNTIRNFFYRRRPVIYLEIIDAVMHILNVLGLQPGQKWPAIDDACISGVEEQFVPFVRDAMRAVAQRAVDVVCGTRILRYIFTLLRPRVIVCIDDVRNWNEVLLAARQSGVRSIGVQHGKFGKYLVGPRNIGLNPRFCVTPDTYIVWSEFWRKELLSLSDMYRLRPDTVIAKGKPFFSEIKPNISHHADSILTIFYPFEPRAVPSECRAYLEQFLQDERVRIVYRIRNDNPLSLQMERLPEAMRNSKRITVVDAMTPELLSAVDVAVGTYSSSLYEMAEAGVPIGVLRAFTTQADDLVEAGFAEYLDLADTNMMYVLRALAATPDHERTRRAKELATPPLFKETLRQVLE